MVDVVPHEGGDHVVRVIVQRLHPHLAGIPGLKGRRSEVIWLQLIVEEAIRRSRSIRMLGVGPEYVFTSSVAS